MTFKKGNVDFGPFLVHKLLSSRPPPLPLSSDASLPTPPPPLFKRRLANRLTSVCHCSVLPMCVAPHRPPVPSPLPSPDRLSKSSGAANPTPEPVHAPSGSPICPRHRASGGGGLKGGVKSRCSSGHWRLESGFSGGGGGGKTAHNTPSKRRPARPPCPTVSGVCKTGSSSATLAQRPMYPPLVIATPLSRLQRAQGTY